MLTLQCVHTRRFICFLPSARRPPPPHRLYSLGARCWDDVTRLSREGEISLPPRALVSLRHVQDLTAAAVPGEEVEEMLQVRGSLKGRQAKGRTMRRRATGVLPCMEPWVHRYG